MNVEYVVENIYFCHHPSWFGPYLALLQYLPTVLLFGAMYWSLNSRDIFFLNLSVTINISWLVVLLFQYAVYSSAIGRKEPGPSTDDDVDPKCRNFFPGILAKAWFIYEDDPISSSSVYRSWEPFPNSDIFLSGIYFGYVATYHLAWKVLPSFILPWVYFSFLWFLGHSYPPNRRVYPFHCVVSWPETSSARRRYAPLSSRERDVIIIYSVVASSEEDPRRNAPRIYIEG